VNTNKHGSRIKGIEYFLPLAVAETLAGRGLPKLDMGFLTGVTGLLFNHESHGMTQNKINTHLSVEFHAFRG
jgi:hypothetical protein